MSVIVKNMEMPKNCAECKMWSICDCLKEFDDYESLLYAVDDGDWVITDDCPLIELPPHGRLGDLDKLWDRMYNYIDNEGAKMPFGDNDFMIHRDSACELIEDAPTVIEAEGET